MMPNQVKQTELAIKVTTPKTLPARFILSMLVTYNIGPEKCHSLPTSKFLESPGNCKFFN